MKCISTIITASLLFWSCTSGNQESKNEQMREAQGDLQKAKTELLTELDEQLTDINYLIEETVDVGVKRELQKAKRKLNRELRRIERTADKELKNALDEAHNELKALGKELEQLGSD